jgi:3-methyl-2-oxobutanoate hydroxymethyltransferase
MKKPDRITALDLSRRKGKDKIVAVTCYDATFARLCVVAGADILLVGDSLGMVIGGEETTLPVTVDEVLYHTRAVARGASRAHVVADMPFLSYQVSVEEAVRNAGRFLKEGGAHAVKLEGGVEMAPVVKRLVAIGIPVMGHVGLTPQAVHAMGGFLLQGKDEASARRILDDAHALAEAGCYAVVLEGIPLELAKRITEEVPVPSIGIGAGPHCDGQVLVLYDLLGMDEALRPRFVKAYESFGERVRDAVGRYAAEVRAGEFPGREHSVSAHKKKA